MLNFMLSRQGKSNHAYVIWKRVEFLLPIAQVHVFIVKVVEGKHENQNQIQKMTNEKLVDNYIYRYLL